MSKLTTPLGKPAGVPMIIPRASSLVSDVPEELGHNGILSTSVHRKGFGMKLSARASSLYVQTVPKDGRIIGRFSYCFQHEEGIVNPTCCLCYAALNSIPLFSIGVFAANMQPLI